MTGEPHVARAILLYILSGFFLSGLDATAKVLALRDYPVWWIVWARYFFHVLVVFPIVWMKAGPGFWRTRRPALQIARSAMLLVATLAFFTALRYLPLAEASAISFLAPMFVILLSGPMLGEKVAPARWVAVGIGFAGTLLITRPGSAAFHPATLLMLVMAAGNALYQILTRKLSADSIYTTLFYTGIAGAVGCSMALPLLPSHPLPGAGDTVLFVLLGVFAGLGHWSMITALQTTQASRLTPFTYLQMAWPLSFGWLLFGQFPDAISIAGMAVIVAAGVWLAWQERRKAQPWVAPPAD
jgi:drug/metabolite transporter (DMT)-like permease